MSLKTIRCFLCTKTDDSQERITCALRCDSENEDMGI